MVTKNTPLFSKRSTFSYLFFIGASMISAVTAGELPEKETKKAASLAYQRVRDEIIDKYKDKNPNLLRYKSPSRPTSISPNPHGSTAKFADLTAQLKEKMEKENEEVNKVGQAVVAIGSATAQKIEDPTLRTGATSLLERLRKFFS
jgi:hypothetical protein